jgi:hypothetical protein
MDIKPLVPSSDKLGTSSAQFAEVNALVVKINGTVAAKNNQALDAFGATTDITAGDATSSKHGLMPKADKIKLDSIATGAQVNPTDAAIAASYASQVAQVSAPEIAAATSTSIRRFSPADIAAIANVRIAALAGGLDAGAVVSAVSSATSNTDSIAEALTEGVITYTVRRKTSSLTSTEGLIQSGTDGITVALGTTASTAAAGNDSRFVTTDQKAAIENSDSPAAGNPLQTLTGVKTIPVDQFAAPSDNTTLDATTGAHGLMPKADKIKLDAIAAGAQVNPTDAAIAASYATQVAQVSAPEIAAGTETAIRRFSPVNIAGIRDAIAQVSAPEIAAGTEAAIRRFSPANISAIADARIAASAPGIGARVILTHTAASTTVGGSAAATTWETRPINTETLDTDNICSLSANQFTLPAGTYDVFGWSIGFQVNGFSIRLYDVTAAAVVSGLSSASSISPASASWAEIARAVINGRLILPTSKTLRLEQYSAVAKASTGFGNPVSLPGVSEVYALIEFTKVA